MPRRLILAAFLHTATVIMIALIGGGWWGLGRVDPLLAAPGLGWASVAMWWAVPSLGWRGGALAGLVTTAICAVAAMALGFGPIPWAQIVILMMMSSAAAAISVDIFNIVARRYATASWRKWLFLAVLTLAIPISVSTLSWRILPSLYAEPTRSDSPHVALLTSLSLAGPQNGVVAALAGEATKAPALALLQQHFHVTMVDALDPAGLADADVLMLAHPRALSPQQLVTIDDWVRGGGRAMILADGLSNWEPPYPMGDPRNPPLTSLLTPLLSHWGLILDAPPGLAAREQAIVADAQRLTLFSAGRLRLTGGGCRLMAMATIADCRIGSGRAIIIADADWLRVQHWGGVSGVGTAANWRSGNMLWLVDRLDTLSAQKAPRAWAAPVWTR